MKRSDVDDAQVWAYLLIGWVVARTAPLAAAGYALYRLGKRNR